MLNNELDMSFNYEPITYGNIKQGNGDKINPKTKTYQNLCNAIQLDKCMADVLIRNGQKGTGFTDMIVWEDNVLPTIKANLSMFRGEEKEKISVIDIIHASTFPEDYDFTNNSFNNVGYICGMSVPPVMTKRVVERLIESGLYDYEFNVT